MASRGEIAAAASEASRASRRRGGPVLTEGSSREALLRWLAWNDPNGTYADADCAAEDLDPLTLEEAWDAVRDQAVED